MKINRIFKIAFALSLFLMVSAALLSCGGGGGGGGGDGGTGTANTMKLKTLSYVDQQGIGTEAFRMLIPSDWNFEGGIEWRFDNPGAPAVAKFWIREPNGKAELQLLPAQSFFSTEDPTVLYYFPVGSKYYGNEVRPYPALGPSETLKQIIIPRFRGNVTNLQIVSEQSLPEVADLLRAGLPAQPNTTTEAAMIRIEYEQNGKPMEEEIYCVIETATFKTYYPLITYNNTLWMADYLFSFKAEKGGLDSQYKIFQTMMYSFRLNPQWFNKYVQLIDYLVQQQITIIQDWGKLSEYISQTSDDISDMVWQSYNNRNAANDRMADDFSHYLNGTDTYYNPIDQNTVELPSGYSDAWVNGLGEYILSDNVNYNPNIGSGQNWQRMEVR
jgi:hypothetical protein